MSLTNKPFTNKKLAFYLLLNAMLLISLIPGGSIETRDFSHINTIVLTAFNALLTALGMCSLIFIPLALNNYRVVAKVSEILALTYAVVYLLDLFSIFPKTQSSMPTLLLVIEVVGVFSAILLFIESIRLQRRITAKRYTQKEGLMKKLSPLCILILVIIGNAVVIFSTYSAINSGN